MKYELIHDTIAQQIHDKVSLEAKARRRIRTLVERQYERHLTNPRILLTREDLDELAPFAGHLGFSPAMESFILRSRQAVDARRRLLAGSVAAAFVVLVTLLGWALYQGKLARAEGRRAKAIALAGKSLEAELAGDLTRSLALARASYRLDSAEETLQALYRAFLRPEAFYYSINQEGLEDRDLNAFLSPQPPHHLLTMTPDGQVTIWDEALQEKARLTGHRGFVNAASFSADGQMLVTGGADSTARLWRLGEQPTLLATMAHGGEVLNVAWNRRQGVIITVSSESTVLRWDTTGRPLDTLLQRPASYRLTLSADGAMIAGSTPAYTCFWDTSGTPIDSLRNPFPPRLLIVGHPLPGNCYPLLIRGFTNAGLYRWCPGEGRLNLIDNQDQALDGAIAIDFAPQGIAFNVASFLRRNDDRATSLINLWTFDAAGKAIAEKMSIPEYGGANFIPLLHPNRRWLYSISDGQTMRRWEIGANAKAYTIAARLPPKSEYRWLQRSAFAFTAGDSLFLLPLTGQDKPLIFPFELRPPELAVTLAGRQIARWEAGTTTIDILDLGGQKLGAIETGLTLIRTLQFSEDGRHLLALGYGRNKHQLLLWNTITGEPPVVIELSAAPLDVRFDPGANDRLFLINPDSDILYAGISGDTLQKLDTLPIVIADPRQLDLVWWPEKGSPDDHRPAGTLLLQARYDSVNIWHQPAGADGQFEPLQTLISADEAFEGARFSSISSLWISLEGATAQVRRLVRGSPLLTTVDGIREVGFSTDGRQLMMLTTDGRLLAWPWPPAAILKKIDAMNIAVPQKELQRLDLEMQKMINMEVH